MARSISSLVRLPMPASGFVSEPDPYMFGNGPNPSNNANWSNENWLKSLFHFSFAEWRKGTSNFGVLRVLNDDLIQPDRGFGTHGHSNMEIFTFILDGELTHKDSMGSSESLGRGSVQFMSAGTGVHHSEYNHSKDTPLRLLQLWIVPDKLVQPRYGSYCGASKEAIEARTDRLAHLASSTSDTKDTPIKLHQDVNIHVSELTGPKTLKFTLNEGRQAYFVSVEGRTSLRAPESCDSIELEQQDAAQLKGPLSLELTSEGKGMWLLVEMKATA